MMKFTTRYWIIVILINLLAASVTYLLVVSGLDWNYFIATRGPLVQAILLPATPIGFILPLLLPIILYVKQQHPAAKLTAVAGMSGWFVSSTYKAFTGRAHPDFFVSNNFLQNSADFHFGFLRGGIFWGWPSSHTTVAFAMSVALVYLYPNKPVLKYLALAYATYIGLGVSTNVHWLSDVVAGALIGTIIGITCSKILAHKSYAKTI